MLNHEASIVPLDTPSCIACVGDGCEEDCAGGGGGGSWIENFVSMCVAFS